VGRTKISSGQEKKVEESKEIRIGDPLDNGGVRGKKERRRKRSQKNLAQAGRRGWVGGRRKWEIIFIFSRGGAYELAYTVEGNSQVKEPERLKIMGFVA